MRRRVSAAIVLTLGGLGIVNCSSTSSQGPAPGTGNFPGTGYSPQPAAGTGTPSASAQTTPKGTRIFGPQLELVRDDKGIRGQGPAGVVELYENKDGFSGLIGTGTTNLHVEPTEGGNFNMRGLFAGALGDLEVRSDRIQGQLGHCQYDLRMVPSEKAGQAYNGERVCGRGSETTTLTLSPQIAELQPLDRGALIAIILGR